MCSASLSISGASFDVRDVVEVVFRVPNLVRIAQCGADKPLSQGCKHDDALALGQHDAAERHHALAAHSLADHREGFLSDLIVRRDVVGAVEKSLVDLLARHERVDLDSVVALDRKGVEFVVLDQDIGVLGVLVAAALILALDRFARDLVDQLLAQPVAGLLVDLAERDPLVARCAGVEGDRTGDERELEVALPIRTRGSHGYLRLVAGAVRLPAAFTDHLARRSAGWRGPIRRCPTLDAERDVGMVLP